MWAGSFLTITIFCCFTDHLFMVSFERSCYILGFVELIILIFLLGPPGIENFFPIGECPGLYLGLCDIGGLTNFSILC